LITSSLAESKEMKVRRVTKKFLFLFEDQEETRGSNNLKIGTHSHEREEELQGK
jgi:hypothetical protein